MSKTRMKSGTNGFSNHPVLVVVPGAEPYLWIGNDHFSDMRCFATISGRKTLQNLARAILKQVAPANKKRRK